MAPDVALQSNNGKKIILFYFIFYSAISRVFNRHKNVRLYTWKKGKKKFWNLLQDLNSIGKYVTTQAQAPSYSNTSSLRQQQHQQ